MGREKGCIIIILLFLTACFCPRFSAQNTRAGTGANSPCSQDAGLNGVFRINVDSSDKLYSVIGEASSNVPFADQQQFFIDLAVRLTPPDLLTIECSDNRVSLASSRAPRLDFVADGVTRTSRGSDGRVVRSQIAFSGNSLNFNSNGGSDNLSFTFTPLENGRRLRVTRRISSRELVEPVVINTVYDKVSESARWDIFSNGSQLAGQTKHPDRSRVSNPVPTENRTSTTATNRRENNEAEQLRQSLYQWIDATNARDIESQMSFYMTQLKAFYLTRNVPRTAVRAEKNRAFARARSIDIRAEEPEIIFQDNGQNAIMRFRKKYNIQNGTRNNSGEVIQELRWQRSGSEWKIFSERDIKVLR